MTLLTFLILIYFTHSYGDKVNHKVAQVDSVQYSMGGSSINYLVQDELSKKEFKLEPQLNTQAGLYVVKGNFALGFSFEDPSNSEETQKYGRTKAFDVQLNTIYKRHFIELYYQKYQGFKLNADDEISKVNYNYESLNYGAQVFHFFNEDYDPNYSLFHYRYKREENASNFLSIDYSQNELKNNQGIIPDEYNNIYSEFKDIKSVYQQNLGITFGRTKQAIFHEHIYLQAMVGVGINYAQTSYRGGELEDSNKTGSKIVMDFDFGYQFKKSLLGVILKTNMNELRGTSTNRMNFNRNDGQIYYHYFF